MEAAAAIADLYQIVLLQQDQLKTQADINHIESRLRDDPTGSRRGPNIAARRKKDKERTKTLRQQLDTRQHKIDELIERLGAEIKP